MSDKKIKKYELSAIIEEKTGTEKDFERGEFDCYSEEEYLATYDTEDEAHQMLGAIQAMIGDDADLAKTIQKLTVENGRLKKGGVKWISVKDRLPECVRTMFVCNMDGDGASAGTGFYGEDSDGQFGWERLDNSINSNVTHWAEINLPEKGGE